MDNTLYRLICYRVSITHSIIQNDVPELKRCRRCMAKLIADWPKQPNGQMMRTLCEYAVIAEKALREYIIITNTRFTITSSNDVAGAKADLDHAWFDLDTCIHLAMIINSSGVEENPDFSTKALVKAFGI